jgi:hypothetical protein
MRASVQATHLVIFLILTKAQFKSQPLLFLLFRVMFRLRILPSKFSLTLRIRIYILLKAKGLEDMRCSEYDIKNPEDSKYWRESKAK